MFTREHLANLLSVSLIVYIVSNIGHELGGHASACVAVGAKLESIAATYVEWNADGVTPFAHGLVKAAGSTVNLVLFLIAQFALRIGSRSGTLGRYSLWLLSTVNSLQAAGYFLFSGLMNVGDWAGIADYSGQPIAVRAALTLIGAGLYLAFIRLSLLQLQEFVGVEGQRAKLSKILCLLPYFAGGLSYVVASLLSPVGVNVLLISAVAASFGGTSALAWMYHLAEKHRFQLAPTAMKSQALSIPWVSAATVLTLFFVIVLGRSISF
jgi:hypothetical protein